MRILIAYGSKRGGTEGLAEVIAETLSYADHDVIVRDARKVEDIDPFDAVIVGGALYAFRWHRHARRFVQRHVEELRRVPVWFFSSGPLDDSATQGDIAPTPQVRRLMQGVHARGHSTFGGRLAPDAGGFIARKMVEGGHGGDFRDFDQARAFARDVARTLETVPEARVPMTRRVDPRSATVRRFAGALALFAGLSATLGGLELMIWPQGPSWAEWLNPSLLAHTPFTDFLIPGLLLFLLPGLGNLVAAVLLLRRHRFGDAFAIVGGMLLAGWLAGELALVQMPALSHVVYATVALATIATAFWHWSLRRTALRRRPVAA